MIRRATRKAAHRRGTGKPNSQKADLNMRSDGGGKSRRGRRPVVRAVPDTEALSDLIKISGRSQREVAAAMNVHESELSKILKGERPLTLARALDMANFLNAPIDHVLRLFRFQAKQRTLPVVGRILENGQVSAAVLDEGASIPAGGAPGDAVAYIGDVAGPHQDAIFVVDTKAATPLDAVGKLAIVTAEGEPHPLLGEVQKSSQRGAVAFRVFTTHEVRTFKRVGQVHILLEIRYRGFSD